MVLGIARNCFEPFELRARRSAETKRPMIPRCMAVRTKIEKRRPHKRDGVESEEEAEADVEKVIDRVRSGGNSRLVKRLGSK